MYFIRVNNADLYHNVFGIPVSSNDIDMTMAYAKQLSKRFPATYQVVTETGDPIGGEYTNGKLHLSNGTVFN